MESKAGNENRLIHMSGLCSSNEPLVTAHTKRNVIYKPESISRQLLDILEVISATQERIDFCIDCKGLSFLVDDKPLWNVIIELINKGMRSRFITKITQENISYCNMLMKYSGEVFHKLKLSQNKRKETSQTDFCDMLQK